MISNGMKLFYIKKETGEGERSLKCFSLKNIIKQITV